MTTQAKFNALQVLKMHNKKTVVGSVYDDNANFASALTCLIPDFEYPSYSYLTIGEIINRIEKPM